MSHKKARSHPGGEHIPRMHSMRDCGGRESINYNRTGVSRTPVLYMGGLPRVCVFMHSCRGGKLRQCESKND